MDLAAFLAAQPVNGDDPMPIVIKGATRLDLPGLLCQRGYRVGAEIGVFQGEYAEILCRNIPGLKLTCVDAWQPYMGATNRRIYFSAVEAYPVAVERLTPYGCTFIRDWSPAAAAQVSDASLDFVYIDADHRFPAVIADLHAWIPKVRTGGIVAGHDWEEEPNPHNHVSVAIKAWTTAYGIRPWYVLGRPKVLRGEPHEWHRTWLWIRQ